MALFDITERDLLRLRPGRDLSLDLRLRSIQREIGGGSGTLAFRRGFYRVMGQFTFGPSVAWWFEPGAVLDVQGALTIQGPLFAAAARIFSTKEEGGIATSNVLLDASLGQKIAEVRPEWWGSGSDNDRGMGLQAMASSLTTAGRTIIVFEGSSYEARTMRLAPGHRFVSVSGTTIRSAAGGTVVEIVHDADTEAPRTSFEGLTFSGLQGSRRGRQDDLVVVRSEQNAAVPLSLTGCAFENTDGVGLALPLGAIVQASNLSAVECGRAGIEVSPGDATSLTLLQWSNSDQDLDFDAAVTVEADDTQAIVQLRDINIGGRLNISGNADSRVSLIRCQTRGALELGLPKAQVIAVDCSFQARTLRQDRTLRGERSCGSKLDAGAVSLFSRCTFDIDLAAIFNAAVDRQEPARPSLLSSLPLDEIIPTLRTARVLGTGPTPFPDFIDFQSVGFNCRVLDVDWGDREGVLLLASTSIQTPVSEGPSTTGLRSRQGVANSIILLDRTEASGLQRCLEIANGGDVLIQRSRLSPLRLARLSARERALNFTVVATLQGERLGGLELSGDQELVCVRFQGGPLPALAVPFEGLRAQTCVWGACVIG